MADRIGSQVLHAAADPDTGDVWGLIAHRSPGIGLLYTARRTGLSSTSRQGLVSARFVGGVNGLTLGFGLIGSFLGAGAVNAWLVPAVIFVLLIVAAWLGLRWIRSEHLETLRAVPLFNLLSERELLSVLSSAHAVAFPSGAVMIRQGENGKGFFVITEGTAKVTLDGEDLVSLASGSYFGEMAVIDGGPRTATITAQTPVSTLEITPNAFLRLVDREPIVAQAFYKELRRRLEMAGNPVQEAGGTRVDRAGLVELCQALRRTQNADWVQATPSRRRRLWFSNLFARGADQ